MTDPNDGGDHLLLQWSEKDSIRNAGGASGISMNPRNPHQAGLLRIRILQEEDVDHHS